MIEDSNQRESPQTTNLENFPSFFSLLCFIFFAFVYRFVRVLGFALDNATTTASITAQIFHVS